MNMSRMRHGLMAIGAGLLAIVPQMAQACAVCSGQYSDSKMAAGMNAGILALLFVVFPVLAVFAVFFVNLGRKSVAASKAAANSNDIKA